MEIQQHGLCIISDKYFEDFPSIRHMNNKHENRPYYLAVKAKNDIIWLIPLSSQVEKYSAKIKVDATKYGDSIFYYITSLKGERKVFLIGNMIPVTKNYIKKAFTVCGTPFVIEDKADIKRIQTKVARYLSLVRNGKLHPAVDILNIERVLTNRLASSEYMI